MDTITDSIHGAQQSCSNGTPGTRTNVLFSSVHDLPIVLGPWSGYSNAGHSLGKRRAATASLLISIIHFHSWRLLGRHESDFAFLSQTSLNGGSRGRSIVIRLHFRNLLLR